MEKQADIRILIACHKPTYVPKNPLFYPMQVGTALTDRRLEGMTYHDNEGDNISEKNPDYCELTAQYWAWKLISYAESLGGVESLITYPMLQTHGDVPVEIRERLGITETFLRLSVGIENVDDLIADLEQALA